MAQFASRPTISRDPEPYRVGDTRYDAMAGAMLGLKYDPRPEYDQPLSNPTSRVLTHIRECAKTSLPDTDLRNTVFRMQNRLIWANLDEHNSTGGGYLRFTDDTVAQLEHATKVLGRIIRILYPQEPKPSLTHGR